MDTLLIIKNTLNFTILAVHIIIFYFLFLNYLNFIFILFFIKILYLFFDYLLINFMTIYYF
jgi:hypothetical protein